MTYKEMLEKEQKALEERLAELDDFIKSDEFDEQSDIQAALLQVQATAMNTYNQCLKERLQQLQRL